MNPVASPFVSLPAVILGLRVAVAAWGGRRLVEEALVHLVHRRLGEIIRRIERMLARFQAGRVRPPGLRRGDEPGLREILRPRQETGARLCPGRFAWLVEEVGWEAAGFGCQLRAVLETPEIVAFLMACPQGIRVLTPVCRMLAIETTVLRPGVEPRANVIAGVRVRVRKQVSREKPDLGRVPIPRGVMGWVRRERAAKRS